MEVKQAMLDTSLKSFKDMFCPILSTGPDGPISCHTNCAWFNPEAQLCDVSVIAAHLISDPDVLEVEKENERQL